MIPLAAAAAIALFNPSVDSDRLIDCIIAVESNPWSSTGGALGFTRKAWFEDTMFIYDHAKLRKYAVPVAQHRILRLESLLIAHGHRPTIYALASCWRRGLDGAEELLRLGKEDDYAGRVKVLFYDQTFRP